MHLKKDQHARLISLFLIYIVTVAFCMPATDEKISGGASLPHEKMIFTRRQKFFPIMVLMNLELAARS